MRLRAVLLILLLLIPLTASAHPGRTDSQGGHYDHSTGEYHFHSGKYADKNQSSSSGSYYYQYPSTVTLEPKPTPRPTVKTSSKSVSSQTTGSSGSDSWIKVDLNWVLILGAALLFLLAVLHETLKSQKKLFKSLDSMELEVEQLKKENAKLKEDHRSLQTHYAALEKESRDFSDLMTTLSLTARERDALDAECKSLRVSQAAFTALYQGLSCRLSAMQSMITSRQRSELMRLGDSRPPEALVYIFGGKSNKFHTHVHGDWINYHLIPISDALSKGYEPCQLCAAKYKSAFRKP